MRKIALLIFLAGILIITITSSTSEVQAASGDEPYAGTPLCLPELYPNGTPDCLAYGPSGLLKSLAEKGIPYPMRELPVVTPDPALGTAPDLYLKVGDQAFPVYASLADAEARNPTRYMDAGMKFLTYYERVDTDTGVYYRLTNGLWVEAGEADTSRYATWMRLFGLFFYQNPANDFGWIIDQADVRTEPGYSAALTGKSLPRETVVQVYDMVNQDGTDWYMIGWNECVERRQIRQFHVNLVPPEGVDNNRWIDINLYEQTLGIYEDGNLIYATLIASGLDPFFTRPGLFQIYKKLEKGDMSGAFEADRSDYY